MLLHLNKIPTVKKAAIVSTDISNSLSPSHKPLSCAVHTVTSLVSRSSAGLILRTGRKDLSLHPCDVPNPGRVVLTCNPLKFANNLLSYTVGFC